MKTTLWRKFSGTTKFITGCKTGPLWFLWSWLIMLFTFSVNSPGSSGRLQFTLRTVSPSLQASIWTLPDDHQSLSFLVRRDSHNNKVSNVLSCLGLFTVNIDNEIKMWLEDCFVHFTYFWHSLWLSRNIAIIDLWRFWLLSISKYHRQ